MGKGRGRRGERQNRERGRDLRKRPERESVWKNIDTGREQSEKREMEKEVCVGFKAL